MELEGMQDLDERMATLRAAVDAECREGREVAERAAADAVRGPLAGRMLVHLAGRNRLVSAPVTPAFEGTARKVLLGVAALPVLALILALIFAA